MCDPRGLPTVPPLGRVLTAILPIIAHAVNTVLRPVRVVENFQRIGLPTVPPPGHVLIAEPIAAALGVVPARSGLLPTARPIPTALSVVQTESHTEVMNWITVMQAGIQQGNWSKTLALVL